MTLVHQRTPNQNGCKLEIFSLVISNSYSVYVVVQFYPWFKFYFPLFWGMVMYENEFKTKGNKI